MARRTQPRKNAAAHQADGHLIAIRWYDDDKKEPTEALIRDKSPSIIVRMAREWGYTLRVRTRWAGDSDMRDHFAEKCIKNLEELGIGRDVIERLASVEHIEVEFYDPDPKATTPRRALEAAAEIPWEYLLSSATLAVGRSDPLLVTRCLSNGSKAAPKRPKRVLIAESAPGRINAEYVFEGEEDRLKAAVNLRKVETLPLPANKGLYCSRTEPLSKLQDTLGKEAWEAIHVTGVDTHHAAWLIDDFYDQIGEDFKADVFDADHQGRLRDGMILRGDKKGEQPVRYEKLADILLASRTLPHVITLNLYYSGVRTARELVARGAYAALGFLDQIDDEFAERFFQAFYWEWCRNNKSIPAAFREAWETMDSDRMHGTGIVIWLGRSMVGQPATSAPRASSAKKMPRGDR